jgi:hypothetical protein
VARAPFASRRYRDFYRWGSIFRGAATKPEWRGRLRHFAYAAGWKKFEPLWDFVIRARRVAQMLPVLETVLGSGGGDAVRGRDLGLLRSPEALTDEVEISTAVTPAVVLDLVLATKHRPQLQDEGAVVRQWS